MECFPPFRLGTTTDGKAKTRMANLGCVFTQHQVDDEGHPIRDPNSNTYVSTMGSLEEFGPLLRQDAIRHPPETNKNWHNRNHRKAST